MARVTAPKSAGYEDRATSEQRLSEIAALRKKQTWTSADRDRVLQLLADQILQTQRPPA